MVWRRVLVPSTCTLGELHGVIQVAMGWEGIHLGSCRVPGWCRRRVSGVMAGTRAANRRECQKPGALRRELDCLLAEASVQHCGPDLKHAVGAAR